MDKPRDQADFRQAVTNLEQKQQTLLKRIGRLKALYLCGVVVLLLMAGWIGYHLFSTGWHIPVFGSKSVDTKGFRTITVQAQPVSKEISLTGILEPFRTVNLVAPFEGPVAELFIEFGKEVKRGEKLLKLDDTDLVIKMRTAEATDIKAKQHLDDIEHWDVSVESREAQRALISAKEKYTTKKRKLTEAKTLFGKGIISGNDLESAKESYSYALNALESARDKFDKETAKGGHDNLRLAQIDLENAEAGLDVYKHQQAQKTITAPVRGIIVRPLTGENSGAAELSVGANVSKGQALMAIADMERILIKAKADEIDIVKIHLGQKVRVTGEAFAGVTLDGQIYRISAQSASDSRDGHPFFDVIVSVDKIPERIARTVRIGMTSELQIVVYENPKALLLPISAVNVTAKTVQVMDSPDGKPRAVKVKTGITTLTDVEITEGLKEGDTVVVPKEQ